MKKLKLRYLLIAGGILLSFTLGKQSGIQEQNEINKSEILSLENALISSKNFNKELCTNLNEINQIAETQGQELADLRSIFESTTFVTQDEKKILERIVAAEATGGNLDQKINVATTVINRVESRSFPNGIKRVVFQDRQFSPIKDGRYYKVDITDKDKEAVDSVLRGNRTHDATFFMVEKWSDKSNVRWFKSALTFDMNDGLHSYYKQ